MSNLGTDFAAVDDIDAELSFNGVGREVYVYLEAIARRLVDDRLFYVRGEYGYNLANAIGAGFVDTRILGAIIENVALRDERTLNASFSGSITDETLDGTLYLETLDGPFRFTVTASQAAGVIVGTA